MHDFITYKISPEYFIWGKELESAKNGFNLDVIILAAKALWSVGLIIGVTFLLANNPNKKTKQLRYLILYKYTFYPLFISLLFALAIGICFYVWGNNIIDIPELMNANVEKHFMTTWGVHIGSYLGGLIGLIIATIRILELRKNALRKA